MSVSWTALTGAVVFELGIVFASRSVNQRGYFLAGTWWKESVLGTNGSVVLGFTFNGAEMSAEVFQCWASLPALYDAESLLEFFDGWTSFPAFLTEAHATDIIEFINPANSQ